MTTKSQTCPARSAKSHARRSITLKKPNIRRAAVLTSFFLCCTFAYASPVQLNPAYVTAYAGAPGCQNGASSTPDSPIAVAFCSDRSLQFSAQAIGNAPTGIASLDFIGSDVLNGANASGTVSLSADAFIQGLVVVSNSSLGSYLLVKPNITLGPNVTGGFTVGCLTSDGSDNRCGDTFSIDEVINSTIVYDNTSNPGSSPFIGFLRIPFSK
jgi:hypothetical protein